ncbi:putative alcohol dehydrogenase [Phyllosticta citricarpa]|uniref:Alcohol dehydrogenase n=1 Tax=Phyllosticta citricarpa TaxID=55181 RepID=A0ABR1M7T0_9PEZI
MTDQASPIKTQALVSRGPFSEGKWAIEDVTLREPREDEVVVEIVASGICHTDLHCGNTRDDQGVPAVFYPRVLGHEGSGYVTRVGSAVTNVQPGDAVLLSFAYCGSCHVCLTGPPSHCTRFFEINFVGEPAFSKPDAANDSIHGRFFGQSSFAKHTVVSSKSVVNVSNLNLSRADLQLLAPLGCGLQTGSGTVINVAAAGPSDSIAILGMGGVGLAAVMAAKMRGCKAIVGIDRVPSRLELARSLGATHTIDTSSSSGGGLAPAQVSQAIRDATEGLGATVCIDTSASPALVAALLDGTRYMGRVIQVGTGLPDAVLSLHMQSFMVSGKTYRGAVQGHCRTAESIPQMVRWWREGVFPVERLVRFWDVREFDKAVAEMGNGEVVKPVLVW